MLNITQFPSRPVKVRWTLPVVPEGTDWKTIFPSKSVRQLVPHISKILQDSQILQSVHSVDQAMYLDWHHYYAKTMIAQDHSVVAKESWLQEKLEMGKQVLLIEFRMQETGERVGGSMILIDIDNVYTHVYRASDRVHISGPPNTSLGLLLDLAFVELAFANRATKISAGSSRNAFGCMNSIGYLGSKFKMGYVPAPAAETEWDQALPRKDETSPHAWFIQKSQNLPLELVLFPNEQSFNGELLTYLQRLQIPYSSYQGEIS